jgi:hypothetical protein
MKLLTALLVISFSAIGADNGIITAVGDSFTAGNHGFDDADKKAPIRSYPAQLAEALGRPVGNDGVGGWSSGRIRAEWLKHATEREKSGIVVLAVGTNNHETEDSALLVADVQAVLDSLPGPAKKLILLLHPHSGEDFTPGQRARIKRHRKALKAAYPALVIDLWDFHVDADGVIAPEYRRYNPDGKRDSLHPNSAWNAEVASRVRTRIVEKGWLETKPSEPRLNETPRLPTPVTPTSPTIP